MNKKTIVGLILGTIILGGGLVSNSSNPTYKNPTVSPSTVTNTKSTVNDLGPTQSNEVGSEKYYINVDGNKVQSPTYSNSGTPAGATAQCRDGTYSFSQHRSGTCSHHGGVAKWL